MRIAAVVAYLGTPILSSIVSAGILVVILGVSNPGASADTPGRTVPPAPILQAGTTWTVTSTAEAGPGTLRQAFGSASPGDLITFDGSVFPPGFPASIYLASALPDLSQGSLTLDATGAGVILDGSGTPVDAVGLRIISQGNLVRGFKILNFPGGGMLLSSTAAENTVQANVISSNGGSCGLQVLGPRNIVVGNFIGTDGGGTMDMGNTHHGVCIGDSSGNYIGPGNLIAHNGGTGIQVSGVGATGNTITQNSITDNASEGIRLDTGGNGNLSAPMITVCTDTSVSGTAPLNCIIEIFSDDDAEGKTYEGVTISDGAGAFAFTKPAGLAGPDITATATDSMGNTSPFSPAASVATEPTTWGEIKAEFVK